jgi:hypothetical protein
MRHLSGVCRRSGRLVLGLGEEGLIPPRFPSDSEYETAMP